MEENSSSRRIMIAIGLVMLFAIIVIIWYFFYAQPATKSNVTDPTNPLPVSEKKPGYEFIKNYIWGDNITSTSSVEVTDKRTLPLVQIWEKPATGQTFLTEQILKEITSSSTQGTTSIDVKRTVRATSSIIKFIDRTTGYVYGYSMETGKTYQISNTLIPGIHDGYIFNGGKKYIARYHDQNKNTIVTVLATIPNVQENEEPLPLLSIEYIPYEVTSITRSEDATKVSYIVDSGNTSTIYSVGIKGQVFVASTPFKNLKLNYSGNNLIVTTKPSAYVLGVTLSVPSFQPVQASRTGLMSIADTDGKILSSMWAKEGLLTFISNDNTPVVLPIKTLAPKCSFGYNNLLICGTPRTLQRGLEGLPDDWFQGRVSFNDDIYAVDVESNTSYPLYIFKDEEGFFDVTMLDISNENFYLTFINKKDGSLWMINTENITKGD